MICLTSKFWNKFHESDDEDVCALVVQLVDDGDIGDEDDDDIDVVLGSDFGKIGGIRGEGSGYQVNIPETWRRRALCHMEYPARPPAPAPAAPRVGHWKVLPDNSMSRIRVSIGVLPTSLTKNNCSITEADTVLNEGSLRRSFPNLVG